MSKWQLDPPSSAESGQRRTYLDTKSFWRTSVQVDDLEISFCIAQVDQFVPPLGPPLSLSLSLVACCPATRSRSVALPMFDVQIVMGRPFTWPKIDSFSSSSLALSTITLKRHYLNHKNNDNKRFCKCNIQTDTKKEIITAFRIGSLFFNCTLIERFDSI
jgi:hypothetical protein